MSFLGVPSTRFPPRRFISYFLSVTTFSVIFIFGENQTKPLTQCDLFPSWSHVITLCSWPCLCQCVPMGSLVSAFSQHTLERWLGRGPRSRVQFLHTSVLRSQWKHTKQMCWNGECSWLRRWKPTPILGWKQRTRERNDAEFFFWAKIHMSISTGNVVRTNNWGRGRAVTLARVLWGCPGESSVRTLPTANKCTAHSSFPDTLQHQPTIHKEHSEEIFWMWEAWNIHQHHRRDHHWSTIKRSNGRRQKLGSTHWSDGTWSRSFNIVCSSRDPQRLGEEQPTRELRGRWYGDSHDQQGQWDCTSQKMVQRVKKTGHLVFIGPWNLETEEEIQ